LAGQRLDEVRDLNHREWSRFRFEFAALRPAGSFSAVESRPAGPRVQVVAVGVQGTWHAVLPERGCAPVVGVTGRWVVRVGPGVGRVHRSTIVDAGLDRD
jgi:hypothetical protein